MEETRDRLRTAEVLGAITSSRWSSATKRLGLVPLLVVVALATAQCDGSQGSDSLEAVDREEPAQEEPSQAPAEASPPATAPSSWQAITFNDEWGEPSGKGAISSWVEPGRAMSFPYGDVRARLMVQDCRLVWIRFTESPNLVGGDIGDGYETHMLAARWNDGEPFIVRVRQQWSDKDLIFSDGGIDVASIAGNQTLAVLLDWYDQGRVMWRFPLDGSSAALAEAGCG